MYSCIESVLTHYLTDVLPRIDYIFENKNLSFDGDSVHVKFVVNTLIIVAVHEFIYEIELIFATLHKMRLRLFTSHSDVITQTQTRTKPS